jgi:hypothetical protein
MSAATTAQCTAIAVALSNHGVRTRTHRLEIVSRLAGRDLTSTKDLTKAEASSILDHLGQLDRIGELDLLVQQYAPQPLTAPSDEEARCA